MKASFKNVATNMVGALFLLGSSCASLNPTIDPSESYRNAIWQDVATANKSTVFVTYGDDSTPAMEEDLGEDIKTYLQDFYDRLHTTRSFGHSFGFIPLIQGNNRFHIFVHLLIPLPDQEHPNKSDGVYLQGEPLFIPISHQEQHETTHSSGQEAQPPSGGVNAPPGASSSPVLKEAFPLLATAFQDPL